MASRRDCAALRADAERCSGVADSTLPLRERERLKRIELAAIKLACLLAKYPATLDRIEQYWPDFCSAASDPPDLQLTRRGLVALWEASGHAQMHRGGAAELRDLFDSPERLFIRLLGKIYFERTGRNPNVGHSNYPASSEGPGHSFGGPFVRFVREASRQFCKGVPVPSPETIRTAIKVIRVRRAGKL